MSKTILIVTDNLPDQINGVVTTYKNIEAHAVLDDYTIVYLDPRRFRYVNCPRYNEVKIALANQRKIGKILNEVNPDYIHIATEGPLGLYTRQYLDKHNYRYNTAYHTKFPEGIKKLTGIPEFITWSYVRWFHKHSGKVLTGTETMVNDLLDHGFQGNIIPWTKGVDREIFNDYQRTTDSEDSDTITLLCVSRVSKEKNLDDFCKIQYPNAKKIMVGDGPYRSELESKYPDVEFVGFKTGLSLAEYYANADVFVFPSRWETFGIVMVESMACGTPVAAYPTDGPLDVIDNGTTGYMEEDLNTAIHRCISLSRDRVKKGSEKWSWEKAWEIFRDNLVKMKKE
jgi:glycosyltransferase involved in cell wall biosynthesis